MAEKASLHAIVQGLVQGVNFRYFVLRNAESLGLTGYVRNLRDMGVDWENERVEVVAEGDREKLEHLVAQLKVGPRAARVKSVNVDWSEYSGEYGKFSVRY
jgi:acylphosphatase